MKDKLKALRERLIQSSLYPDQFYATEAVLNDVGFPKGDGLPAELVKGVSTTGMLKLEIDHNALDACIRSLPEPKLDIEKIISPDRTIGLG
jgi:hypothetical protein